MAIVSCGRRRRIPAAWVRRKVAKWDEDVDAVEDDLKCRSCVDVTSGFVMVERSDFMAIVLCYRRAAGAQS